MTTVLANATIVCLANETMPVLTTTITMTANTSIPAITVKSTNVTATCTASNVTMTPVTVTSNITQTVVEAVSTASTCPSSTASACTTCFYADVLVFPANGCYRPYTRPVYPLQQVALSLTSGCTQLPETDTSLYFDAIGKLPSGQSCMLLAYSSKRCTGIATSYPVVDYSKRCFNQKGMNSVQLFCDGNS